MYAAYLLTWLIQLALLRYMGAEVGVNLSPVCQWESRYAEPKFGHSADARSCASASANVRPRITWIRSTLKLSSLLELRKWESSREDTAWEI